MSGRSAASVHVSRVEPRFVGFDHGEAMFVKKQQDAAPGATLLEETPVAARQSLAQREAWGIRRSCPWCLAFRGTVQQECCRLADVLRRHTEVAGSAAPTYSHDEEDDRLLAELTSTIPDSIEKHLARTRRVLRAPTRQQVLPFPWFDSSSEETDTSDDKGPAPTQGCASCGCGDLGLAQPCPRAQCAALADGVVGDGDVCGWSAAWARVQSIGDVQDERAWLVADLWVQALQGTLPTVDRLENADAPARGLGVPNNERPPQQCRVRDAVDSLSAFTDGFARGAFRFQSPEQRDVLRRLGGALTAMGRHVCDCTACASGSDAADSERAAVPAQLILTLRTALDANLHTVIVINPLWSLCQAWLAEDAGSDKRCVADQLSNAFARAPAEAAHNMGFGLFALGSRFNHSCAPNAQFVPTVAPVRGRCVVLSSSSAPHGGGGGGGGGGGLKGGEEARISYVDTTLPFEARRKALAHYDFDCDCERCAEDAVATTSARDKHES